MPDEDTLRRLREALAASDGKPVHFTFAPDEVKALRLILDSYPGLYRSYVRACEDRDAVRDSQLREQIA